MYVCVSILRIGAYREREVYAWTQPGHQPHLTQSLQSNRAFHFSKKRERQNEALKGRAYMWLFKALDIKQSMIGEARYWRATRQLSSKSFPSPVGVLTGPQLPFLHSGVSLPFQDTPPCTQDRLTPKNNNGSGQKCAL